MSHPAIHIKGNSFFIHKRKKIYKNQLKMSTKAGAKWPTTDAKSDWESTLQAAKASGHGIVLVVKEPPSMVERYFYALDKRAVTRSPPPPQHKYLMAITVNRKTYLFLNTDPQSKTNRLLEKYGRYKMYTPDGIEFSYIKLPLEHFDELSRAPKVDHDATAVEYFEIRKLQVKSVGRQDVAQGADSGAVKVGEAATRLQLEEAPPKQALDGSGPTDGGAKGARQVEDQLRDTGRRVAAVQSGAQEVKPAQSGPGDPGCGGRQATKTDEQLQSKEAPPKQASDGGAIGAGQVEDQLRSTGRRVAAVQSGAQVVKPAQSGPRAPKPQPNHQQQWPSAQNGPGAPESGLDDDWARTWSRLEQHKTWA